MANKKINELVTRTPSLTDLMLVGDPSSGYSYKCTITSLATIIETDIADGYVTLGTTQTITGAKTFSNNLTLTSVSNAGVDTDKFLVLNGSNVVNFRTGSEVLSDIGGQGTITLTTTGTSGAATLVGNILNIPNYAPDLSGYVPTSRTITINGTTQDLTANRTYNVGTVTSVAASGGTGISISGSPITSSGTITITNTAPDQVVALTAGTGISISGTYPNFTITNSSPSLGGTVTSVALSAPTGFSVSGSPITSSGTLALSFASGYSLPTTASQANWDTAYTNRITSLTTTGTSGAATLVGNTLNIPQYQGVITLTTTGSSGSATLVGNTLNVPTYTLAGLGGISLTSLSALAPLSYNNTTGVFSIALATASTDGYLRFQDWNFFADKIGGSGTTNYIPKFTSSSAIGNSLLREGTNSIGLGYTPSTWSYTGFQINGAALHGSPTETDAGLSANAYYNSGWKYYANNYASQYRQVNGEHEFNIAGIGTAGNSVSFSTAIKILTSGNVGIGTTNPAQKLDVTSSNTTSYASSSASLIQPDGGVNALIANTGTAGFSSLRFASLNGSYAIGYIGFNNTTSSVGGSFVFGQRNGASSYTEQMRLDASGNLGLGVSPSAWGNIFTALQIKNTSISAVNGIVSVIGGNSFYNGTSYAYIQNGFANQLEINNSGGFLFNIAPSGTAGNAISFTQAMTLDASGLLNVGGTGGTKRLNVFGDSRILNVAPTLDFTLSTNTAFSHSIVASNYSSSPISSNTLEFRVASGASTQATVMTLNGAGNVGIGTTSPTQTFDVRGTGVFGNGTSSYYVDASADATNAFVRASGTTDGMFVGTRNATAFRIFTNDSEKMRITSGGNVGIGTDIPGRQLEVYSATTDTRIAITNTTSTSGAAKGLELLLAGSDGYAFNYANGALIFGTNATERMRITSGGNVQIATGSIQTGDPSGGTKKPWKLGAATVTSVSHYGYAQVEIDGVAYYVGLVTAN